MVDELKQIQFKVFFFLLLFLKVAFIIIAEHIRAVSGLKYLAAIIALFLIVNALTHLVLFKRKDIK